MSENKNKKPERGIALSAIFGVLIGATYGGHNP